MVHIVTIVMKSDSERYVYPLVLTITWLLKMAMEIVELPIINGDFP